KTQPRPFQEWLVENQQAIFHFWEKFFVENTPGMRDILMEKGHTREVDSGVLRDENNNGILDSRRLMNDGLPIVERPGTKWLLFSIGQYLGNGFPADLENVELYIDQYQALKVSKIFETLDGDLYRGEYRFPGVQQDEPALRRMFNEMTALTRLANGEAD